MGGKGDRPTVENRWWVDQQKDSSGHIIERPPAKYGGRFFHTGAGFEQERAQRRLTDSNLKWLQEAPGAPGEWVVVQLLPKEHVAEKRVLRARAALPIPPDGHAVLVDSGTALRAIITGHPIGERLVEVRLGEDASFDAWVRGEWVREAAFRNFDDALRRAPALVREYLMTDRAEQFL